MTDPSDDLYTDTLDGEEVVGVLFDPQDGQFYEFADPSDHDKVERVVCPRTGDVLEWESVTERMMGEIMSGHLRATVPVDEWRDFREDYIDAEDDEFGEWADRWREISRADSREEGGVVKCNHCGEQNWFDDPSRGDLGPTCPECGHPVNDPKARSD